MVRATNPFQNFDFDDLRPRLPYFFLNRAQCLNQTERQKHPIKKFSSNIASVYDLHKTVEDSKLDYFTKLVKYKNHDDAKKLSQSVDLEKQFNYDGYEGITVLGLAAYNNDIDMLDILLKAGANIEGGETCAEEVAFCEHESASKALYHLIDIKEEKGIKTYIEKISTLA